MEKASTRAVVIAVLIVLAQVLASFYAIVYGSDYVSTQSAEAGSACDAIIKRLENWYGTPERWSKFPVYFRGYTGNGVAGYTQYSGDRVSEVVVYFPLEKTEGGTLDHELTHAFTFFLVGGNYDLFFNEGASQCSEVKRLDELRTATYQQYARGEFWRLRDLIGRNRYDDRLRMYRQSYSVVEMLIRLGGRDYFGRFLCELKSSGDVDGTLERFYGFGSVDELEAKWIEYLNNGQEF